MNGFARQNRAQGPPYALSVGGAGRGERQVELVQVAIEIGVQLVARAPQQGRVGLIAPPAPVNGNDAPRVFSDSEITDWRMQGKLRQCVAL